MVYFSKWKIVSILLVVIAGFVFAAPNFFDEETVESFPEFVPDQRVNLGLDLQGGAHLLIQVETGKIMQTRLTNLEDAIRDALRQKRIRYSGLGVQGRSVTVTIREREKFEEAQAELAEIVENAGGTAGGSVAGGLFGGFGGGVTAGTSNLELDFNEDTGKATLTYTESGLQSLKSDTVARTVEVIRDRVDGFGVSEPTIQRQGDERIVVQLPGLQDPERIKDRLKQTAQLTFHLLHPTLGYSPPQGPTPPGYQVLPMNEDPNREIMIRRAVMVSGERLTDANATFDQNGLPAVSLSFDQRGARQFCRITTRNVEKPFAIVLDNKVLSAPVIREAICGGQAQISGGQMTTQEANDLSILLRAGALPADLTYIEERTVGPGLGQDSIDAGKIASVVGLVLVIFFMAIVYGRFGLFADVALLVNLILILAALSAFGATLTLPGIAGIVLTIGMAVDANVLIFERIKEEVRAGRTPLSAIEAGYGRALTTIIDANVTTLIAAILLFQFGSGPIRGFAVTLAIGIITSMFTAIMFTRLLVVSWLRRRKPSELPI